MKGILILILFSINSVSAFNTDLSNFNGYIKISKSVTDKNWNFMPEINNSFDYSQTLINEIFLINNKFGLLYSNSNFTLDLIRPIYPINLSLTAESNLFEATYIINNANAFSLSYKDQVADTQSIECYTFGSLTIGFCNEAKISISNTKDKYIPLNGNTLMLIDGINQELKLKYIQAIDASLLDEYYLYFALSRNKFDWLSPIEELTSGFISNLSYGGSTIGELVGREISRLPQRSEWFFYKLGLNVNNSISLLRYIDFIYELDLILVDTNNYTPYKNIPNHNLMLKTGFKVHNNNNLELYLSGSIYKNNLFGYEDISFNQRSEHHFLSNFGSMNISIKYLF